MGGKGAYALWQNGQALGAQDLDICVKTLELAAKTGNPIVTFYNSPGTLPGEELSSLSAAKSLSIAVSRLSGVVPQISVVTGTCVASSAMAAASADLTILCRDAIFSLTPLQGTAEENKVVSTSGAEAAVATGLAAVVADTGEMAAQHAAHLITMLPANNLASPAEFAFVPPIGVLDKTHYSASAGVAAIADEGSAFELFAGFGKGCSVSLATLSGAVCGIVSTAGEDVPLDGDDVAKTARFVRFCDAFSLPVVTILNTAGFGQPTGESPVGNLREMARLASTYTDATTAKLAVITGKAGGSLYTALACADLTIALEGSLVIAAKPADAASVPAHGTPEHSDLSSADMHKTQTGAATAMNAHALQKAGLADFIADAETLRSTVSSALDILVTKRTQRLPKKHGNMPL